MNNRKGSSYILVCVTVLSLILLILFLFEAVSMYFEVTSTDREIRNRTDTAINRLNEEYFDAVKNGTDFSYFVTGDEIKQRFLETAGLNTTVGRSEVTVESVSVTVTDSFEIKIRYSVKTKLLVAGNIGTVRYSRSLIRSGSAKW